MRIINGVLVLNHMTCSGVATAAMFEKHSHVLEHTLQKQHKTQFCSLHVSLFI
jgi:hypothetical protein